jgi:predicted ATPase with chaperone activity
MNAEIRTSGSLWSHRVFQQLFWAHALSPFSSGLSSLALGFLEHAMEEMNFSARAHDRILKVARTLADLAGSPNIRATDVLEAIQYRSLARKLFF